MSGSMTPQPPGGGAPPPSPGMPPQSGSPSPIGSSPMTGATQNLGKLAQAQKLVGGLLTGMSMALVLAGPGTELGHALNKAMLDLGKLVPPETATPGGSADGLKQMALKQGQMAPHQAAGAAGAMRPPGAAGAAPGAAPGGMPPAA